MNSVWKILLSPYPMPGQKGMKHALKIGILTGIFIFLFLYFLSPLDLDIQGNSADIFVTLSYGLITAFVIVLFLGFTSEILPKFFKEDRWNFLKGLIYILIMVLFIALGNFIFTVLYFETVSFNFQSLISSTVGTLVIAIFPTTFFLAIDLVRHEKEYVKDSEEVEIPSSHELEHKVLVFQSNYDEPDFKISVNQFLFAEADSNYVTFYYLDTSILKKSILRTTLKNVEASLSNYKMIIKTHRSYVVNLQLISGFDGNAQGYVLSFTDTDVKAKVSRTYTKQVKEILQKTP